MAVNKPRRGRPQRCRTQALSPQDQGHGQETLEQHSTESGQFIDQKGKGKFKGVRRER